jgi:vacuolar protein sorting-associated protein 72
MYAYKEIQRLHNGDYQWSRVLGAWVGNTKHAARGVPERFLNPDSVTPPKTSAVPEDSGVKNEEKPGQKTDEAASKPAPGTNPIVKSEAEGSGQVAQPTPQVTVQGQH